MRVPYLPKKQGLYDPNFEHDNCGIGFLANVKGKATHKTVKDALLLLENLEHRGGQGDEENTGDGAGILTQIPHAFFREKGLIQRDKGEYAVGMVFLPRHKQTRAEVKQQIEAIVAEEEVDLIHWRDVPTDSSSLGNAALQSMPVIEQLFVSPKTNLTGLELERKLYVIRKRAEHEVQMSSEHSFYFASFSSRTIVYKGMLTTAQLTLFYLDLSDPLFTSALALVHSRFSTNTFPSWERAHPNRYMIHNGEINTIKGNVNWMHAREAKFETPVFGNDLQKLHPIIDQDGSDSSMFDNTLEFLSLSGRSLAHAAMMMVPEPWQNNGQMDTTRRSFYEYHSTLMEPWDGPTAIVFTDGTKIGATLDRNGLRPSRYYLTSDDMIVMSSEVGVLELPSHTIVKKERLHPGQLLLIDLEEGRLIPDEEIKQSIASEHPYEEWVRDGLRHIDDVLETANVPETEFEHIRLRQFIFGYTYEELNKMIMPLVKEENDPVGSMGYDSPLAVLSKKPQLLYNYFKQLFAQVTNPPIDAIREKVVTAQGTTIGKEGNLLDPKKESCQHIHLPTPILNNEELAKLRSNQLAGFEAETIPMLFPANEAGLAEGLATLCTKADQAIEAGKTLLILSDRDVTADEAPIPALLAVSSLHHHLIRTGKRTDVSLLLESGEPREVHHHALLIGYGAEGINPYLVFDTIDEWIQEELLTEYHYVEACSRYVNGVTKGLMKVLSKMGISTIHSYRGAQIFEAIGIHPDVIDQHFTWTPSRIGGIQLKDIAKEVLVRHSRGFTTRAGDDDQLDSGDDLQWRRDGEAHQYNPHTIHMLQQACRTADYNLFKHYTNAINTQDEKQTSLRGLLSFKQATPISIEEVEPASSIVKRFRTGAMSFGSISKEAHETLAIAMNRLGAKSNTGEGGEDPSRFTPDENGDLRRSSIKQVASGRFGVTSNYLVNADEIQIKVAQGAKPGEGGQLPGQKVYPWVAEVRGSTTGVGLISPPPHHDIYSIEDLAELIHDLKNANPSAKVSVKLVAGTGVGTIAAGVAKGSADGIIISGYDGGTGAAARTSIKHTGLPWEIGLAETHQTLLLNNLRNRVTLETDGKLMTGRDVVIAALLGAEEFAFSTAPLVVLGCVVMRVCHLDTCPVGIATQNPELRKKYTGEADQIVTFMTYIAEEMREIMAELGVKTIDELVGRSDLLTQRTTTNEKANSIDLSSVLYRPANTSEQQQIKQVEQNHKLDQSLDVRELLEQAKPAIENGEKVSYQTTIRNTDRVVGTIVGSEVSKAYGLAGLSEHTIQFCFTGSAGQSFGAFIPKGVTLTLEGDANDYTGKGLSGGQINVFPPKEAAFVAKDNVIIGNTSFYGATSGKAFIAGQAGERFGVRNSGAQVVIEGMGDHGLEYMTGGICINLGNVGKNFAAGMSGGTAYVYDPEACIAEKSNHEMILLESLASGDESLVKTLIEEHVRFTSSTHGEMILSNWEEHKEYFVKVIPKDYKQMLSAIERRKQEGLNDDEAALAAFDEKITKLSNV
ncbi:glutamate synthase large subunit [Shouchella lehensis]|uniref:Glutamate synthase subunit n=1 Tax=Shouchella lehensis G1 TaxID=1246626 RepID=A0A060M398_9BACI|nr:glutamate synthase large subunit [Shouchella lehensis]AIC94544.1 glutamate synthase subunit [Shouchella lehensis G1]